MDAIVTANGSEGFSLLASSLSARTRNASASTDRIASSLLGPYARTPGNSGISAIQRPSSSRSVSIRKLYAMDLIISAVGESAEKVKSARLRVKEALKRRAEWRHIWGRRLGYPRGTK